MSLNLQSVQATMLIPLWGRATASEKDPEILH
jgi:O-methyltransferase involved in polyketide biosynthesis